LPNHNYKIINGIKVLTKINIIIILLKEEVKSILNFKKLSNLNN